MLVEPSTPVSLDVRDGPSAATPHRYGGKPPIKLLPLILSILSHTDAVSCTHTPPRDQPPQQSFSHTWVLPHLLLSFFFTSMEVKKMTEGVGHRTLETHRISQHTQHYHQGCMPRSFFFLVGSHFMHHTAEQSRYFQPHYQASDV